MDSIARNEAKLGNYRQNKKNKIDSVVDLRLATGLETRRTHLCGKTALLLHLVARVALGPHFRTPYPLHPDGKFNFMMTTRMVRRCALSIGLGACLVGAATAQTPPLPAASSTPSAPLPSLVTHGEDFVDPAGHSVKFWGVDLIALYPDHAQSDALAANLASLGINLVRPHHLLRSSLDWNPTMASGSLALYKTNSRDLDPDALDRFDYLTAALRRNGIYLTLATNFSRSYRPDDVDILQTDDQDRTAWMAAMKDLNGWNWQKSIDPYKMLPSVDERAALLNEEFIKKLLTHANPYSGTTFAKDTQPLILEVMNEASTEYSIICGNRLPDYFQKELEAKWSAYATAAGIEPGDLYKPADTKAKGIRANFFHKLDEDYFLRIKRAVRGLGCNVPMEYSNLWRGDNATNMEANDADTIEDHDYGDPLVVGNLKDLFYDLSHTRVAGKPYIVGELNQAEGGENIKKQSAVRTMLPLAASAYGSLQNWSGIVWFAWTHGASTVGADGWSTSEGRTSDLGRMIDDGMMIDHLRTTSLIFRRRLLEKSKSPITLVVDEPYAVGDYNGLMRGKYVYEPGWQNIHGVYKTFGTVLPEQEAAPWMKQAPPNPLVSDTGQITKDLDRKQLTVAAPKTEAFSGYLDDKAPAGLKHLSLDGASFATVVVVADDDQDLTASGHLIISRTGLDAQDAEVTGLAVHLHGLKTPPPGQHWFMKLTRPRAETAPDQSLNPAADGSIDLPLTDWHECELSVH